jgi:CBS domain containing-hemolysin-like protein
MVMQTQSLVEARQLAKSGPTNRDVVRSRVMFSERKRAVKVMVCGAALMLLTTPTRASIFEGETLDMVANILSWAVLVIAPAVGITVFWLLHIMPEKIAERRHHPQAKAIQTLCLLSLFFGGLLWPLAWLWAYSKPVLYKMAYGTDKVVHGAEDAAHPAATHDEGHNERPDIAGVGGPEVERLRKRIAELEGKIAAKPATERGMEGTA